MTYTQINFNDNVLKITVSLCYHMAKEYSWNSHIETVFKAAMDFYRGLLYRFRLSYRLST